MNRLGLTNAEYKRLKSFEDSKILITLLRDPLPGSLLGGCQDFLRAWLRNETPGEPFNRCMIEAIKKRYKAK